MTSGSSPSDSNSSVGKRCDPLPATVERVPFPGVRLIVVILILAAGALPSMLIGPLGPFLIRDLGVSVAQLGSLWSIFNLMSGVLSPAAGRLVDARGPSWVAVRMLGVTALSLLACAAAPSFPVLVAGFAAAGSVYSAGHPSTNSLISSEVSMGPARGLVLGLKHAGIPLSIAVAGLILPTVAVGFNWRVAMVVSAVIVSVVATLARRMFGMRREPSRFLSTSRRQTAVWPLAAYSFLMAAAASCYTVYLPAYLLSLGYEPHVSGLLFSFGGLIGIVMMVWWGHLSMRLLGPRLRLPFVASGVGGFICALAALAAEAQPGLALWLVVAYGAFLFGWNASLSVAIVGRDRSAVGTNGGLVYGGFYLGLTFAPPMFGWLVEMGGSYAWGWIGAGGLATGATVVALLIRTSRSGEPIPRRAN